MYGFLFPKISVYVIMGKKSNLYMRIGWKEKGMLQETYERIIKLFEANHGYLSAAQLREEKITTIQVKQLLTDGILEKVSHGHYWLVDREHGKPEYYKMIEVCRSHPKAVICADSACYYHGLIKKEPKKLSVATLKTDRSRMRFSFPITRHYYSNLAFEQELQTVDTSCGPIRVYGVERSVCDAIRFRKDIGKKQVSEIITNYMKSNHKQLERLYAYADAMRVGKIVRTGLEEGKIR